LGVTRDTDHAYNGHTIVYDFGMGPIQQLATDLSIEERTLRRAAAQGTIRCRRAGPRKLRLAPGEQAYLRDHWQILSDLRRALRTERSVRLAVLYGSMARGDDEEDSDLDLLVSLADDRPLATVSLAMNLERKVSRNVDVARLPRIESNAPLLLDRVLDEGRVVVDRDELWRPLQERRRAIRARAKRSHRRQMSEAAQAIEELTS
jgi:predicted nucleotidyltransferase